MDLGAQGGVDVGELEADVAAADDGDPVGDPLELERVVRGEDGLAVDLDARGDEGDGARREDDVLGGDELVGAGLLHLVRARIDAGLGNDVHTERRQRVAEVLLHVARKLLGVRGDGLTVVLDVVHCDAEALEMLRVAHLTYTAGGSEKSLRWYAAAVHASAPNVPSSENGSFETLSYNQNEISTLRNETSFSVFIHYCNGKTKVLRQTNCTTGHQSTVAIKSANTKMVAYILDTRT